MSVILQRVWEQKFFAVLLIGSLLYHQKNLYIINYSICLCSSCIGYLIRFEFDDNYQGDLIAL